MSNCPADEEMLAARLGLSPRSVRSLRQAFMVEGEHFRMVGPKRVTCEYTEKGRGLIKELALGEAHELRVLRWYPNPTWIAVEKPDGSVADVRVKNAKKMRKGASLRCLVTSGRVLCLEDDQKPHDAIL